MDLSPARARYLIEESASAIAKSTGYNISLDVHTRQYGKMGFCMNAPGIRHIGIDTTWIDNAETHVSEQKFIDTLIALYHECAHMHQYDALNTGDGDEVLMALTITDNINRAYYLTNYTNNLRELDADLTGIQQAYQFLAGQDIPEYDHLILQAMQRRVRSPRSVCYNMPSEKMTDIYTIEACYTKKIMDIRTGRIFATDCQYASDDPAFQYLKQIPRLADLYCKIPVSDFILLTEFLAAVSLQVDKSILSEFPDNAYLASLDLDRISARIMKYNTSTPDRDLLFSATKPAWYQRASRSSVACIDSILNERN